MKENKISPEILDWLKKNRKPQEHREQIQLPIPDNFLPETKPNHINDDSSEPNVISLV